MKESWIKCVMKPFLFDPTAVEAEQAKVYRQRVWPLPHHITYVEVYNKVRQTQEDLKQSWEKETEILIILNYINQLYKAQILMHE